MDSDCATSTQTQHLLGVDVDIDSRDCEDTYARTFMSSLSARSRIRNNRSKHELDFQSLGYYGRDREIVTLVRAYDRVCGEDHPSELVVVHGQSGTGKSTLAKGLSDKVLQSGGILISGKFDQIRRNEPFSAIVDAFTDLCDIIQNDESSMVAMLGKEDARKLKNLVYNLYRVDGNGQDEDVEALTAMSLRAKLSLTECCCKFLRNVATAENPIVLFLDDLQWADESSIELINAIVHDNSSRNLLLLCAIRDSELAEESLPFDLPVEGGINFTRIKLSNLQLGCINTMVADLLGMSKEDTEPLSKTIMQKTHGNPYFALQFLEMLHTDRHIIRAPSGSWQWNVRRILAETNISDNVVELVSSKIQRLETERQYVLQLAACMGFEFNAEILDELVKAEIEGSKSALQRVSSTIDILKSSVAAGLVEKKTDLLYKFSHDRVQQCLYAMAPEGEERERLHLRIGVLIWRLAEKRDNEEWMVFAAAGQMNRCLTKLASEERALVARVNLEAAISSKQKSALEAAAEFLRTGVKLLDSDWAVYQLQLKLCTMLAEIEYSMGNLEESRKLIYEILAHAREDNDKMRAYYTLIDCLGTEGKLLEAVAVGYKTLKLVGIRLPNKANPLRVLRELLKTRKLVNNVSDEELLSLPMVKDEAKLAPLHLMSLISTYAPFLNEEKQVLLLYLRVIQLSVKDGISCLSPQCFAFYGIVMASLGNRDEAYRFGQLSLKLIERIGNNICEARAVSLIHCGLLHWKHPIRESLEPLTHGIEAGRSSGDIKYVFFAQFTHLLIRFNIGDSLDELEARCRECCEDDYFCNDSAQLMLVRPYWQTILNLQDESSSVTLTGEAMNEKDFIREATATKNSGALFLLWMMKVQLAFLSDELERAILPLRKLESDEKNVFFHFNVYPYRLYAALVYYGLWHRKKSRKYRSRARKHTKKLEKLMAEGNVNCAPMVKILRAEQKMTGAIGKSNDRARLAYKEAIKECAKAELPHLEALSNERAWMACSERDLEQKEYMARAIQLYSQWGANSKVGWLVTRCTSVPPTVTSGKSLNRQQLNLAEPVHFGPAWCP